MPAAVFFPAGADVAEDVALVEEADLAAVTFLVGSVEPLPVAFFPPVVFAIAILASAWKTNRWKPYIIARWVALS
ncbi:hypothetical protein BVI2075_820034 [Burkholderia vietnamiensis]|nr:hypothetical protein BVI1335_1030031 [Burkholderia vietnamiensis]CAG9222762.1 hypothetical protein BVI2075_820034 [Burkholderia vietnamiensis]